MYIKPRDNPDYPSSEQWQSFLRCELWISRLESRGIFLKLNYLKALWLKVFSEPNSWESELGLLQRSTRQWKRLMSKTQLIFCQSIINFAKLQNNSFLSTKELIRIKIITNVVSFLALHSYVLIAYLFETTGTKLLNFVINYKWPCLRFVCKSWFVWFSRLPGSSDTAAWSLDRLNTTYQPRLYTPSFPFSTPYTFELTKSINIKIDNIVFNTIQIRQTKNVSITVKDTYRYRDNFHCTFHSSLQ